VLVNSYGYQDQEAFRSFVFSLSQTGEVSLSKVKFKLGIKARPRTKVLAALELDEASEQELKA